MLYALMQSPVLAIVYGQLDFTSEEKKAKDVRFLDCLLQGYAELNLLPGRSEDQSIALGIQSLITQVLLSYVQNDMAAYNISKKELKEYMLNKQLVASSDGRLNRVTDDLLSMLTSSFSPEEEAKGSDHDSNGGAIKSTASMPNKFTNYSRYKRFMQMDFDELSIGDKIRFLLTATFDGESVLDEATINLGESAAQLKHESSTPREQLRRSALHYLGDICLRQILVTLVQDGELSAYGNLYEKITNELHRRERFTDQQCLEQLVKLTKTTADFKLSYVNASQDKDVEIDDAGREKNAVSAEISALVQALDAYFGSMLNEAVLNKTSEFPPVFSGIPSKLLQEIFKNPLISDECQSISQLMKEAGASVGNLEKTDHQLESEHKRVMVLQLMLRYFSVDGFQKDFGQLNQFIAKSGIGKGSKDYLKRFAKLLTLSQDITDLINSYKEKMPNKWKLSVVMLIHNRLQEMINYPSKQAQEAALIDPAWERRLKTLLAIVGPGSRIRAKADEGVFSHRLKEMLEGLESCVTVSQFNVSEKVLAQELRGHGKREGSDLYSAYLFQYVVTHFPDLLIDENGSSYLEGSFGRSVIRGAAKYDKHIVPVYFQHLGNVSDNSAVIKAISQAFQVSKDKYEFASDLKSLDLDSRVSLLLDVGNQKKLFLAKKEVCLLTDFSDYVACLQRVLVSGAPDPVQVTKIQAIWAKKCSYWQELHDQNEQDGWRLVKAVEETLDFAGRAAEFIIKLDSAPNLADVCKKMRAVVGQAKDHSGAPVSELIALAQSLSIAKHQGYLTRKTADELRKSFGFSALFHNPAFIRNLYQGMKTLPLSDFWTLRRYFMFTVHGVHYDTLEEPFKKQQLCDELFDRAGMRDPVNDNYKQLSFLINTYRLLVDIQHTYQKRAIANKQAETGFVDPDNFNIEYLSPEERQKWQVCDDFIQELDVLAGSEFSRLDKVAAPLEALKGDLKTYFDYLGNAEKLRIAESGIDSELKKVMQPLSKWCGAECNYRSKLLKNTSMWSRLKPDRGALRMLGRRSKKGSDDGFDFF